MKRSFLSFIISLLIIQGQALIFPSCANIIPPTGGPRDTLPPVLVKAVPPDSSLNFNSKKITLTFNEYIQLDSRIQSDLIVSPNPELMPFVSSHLRDVTILLKDTLRPNTTYSIDFGNNLKDINEGNIYRNFTFVFSTGKTLASGTLSGKVMLAETGTTDSTLIVILHNNLNDSAIKKLRPFYFTRIDREGNFNFRFLESGTYNVFVLPNDYTRKYDDSTKMFAFLDEPVTIDETTSPSPLTLFAFNEYPPGKEAPGEAPTQQQPPSNKKKNADTANLKIATNLTNATQSLLSNLIISLNRSVKSFDSSKIILTDTNYKPVAAHRIVADSLFKNFSLNFPWKEEQHFKLIIQQDAFVDSSGKTLAKNDTITFNTASESEYGSIRLRFSNLDLSKNPVLQLVQNNKVVDSVALTGTEFYRQLYWPGDYDMRILFDTDKNMRWTPGSFSIRRQPEITIRIPKKLIIKPNWDNEVNVVL